MGELTTADGLTLEGRHILRIINFTAASLSIAGCLFIIVCFFYLKRTQQAALRLVVCLSILDMISNIGTYFENSEDSPTSCAFAGWWATMFDLCPILWTTCISFHLYYSIFKGKQGKKAFLGYFLYALGVPLIISFIALGMDLYGDAGDVCWLKSPASRLILFYLPLWLCIIFNTVKYVLITMEFNRIFRRHNLHHSSPQLHRLKAYPMILVICWTVASIHRIMDTFWADAVFPFWLYGLHFALAKLQGFFNALVYGMDPYLLKELKHKLLGTASPWDQPKEDIEFPDGLPDQWPSAVGEGSVANAMGEVAHALRYISGGEEEPTDDVKA